jgi:Protein of unknown function (DUF1161)
MKTFRALTALLILAPTAAMASCDDVKATINGQLRAKNPPPFTLLVRDASADHSDGKVYGNCEAGKRLIIYKKEAAAAPESSGK